MRKIFFIPLILLIFSSYSTFAQSDHSMVKKLEHEAREYYRGYKYLAALPLYLKVDSLMPGNAEVNFRIGVCYFNTFGKSRSLPYFEKANSMDYENSDMDLYLAHAYHLNHQFDKAIAQFQLYKATGSPDPDDGMLYPEQYDIDRYIEMCKVGKDLVGDSLDLVIENMGPDINSKYPEYVPLLSADEHMMIFTSRRPNTIGGKTEAQDGHYFEDIYYCLKDSNGKWSAPMDMGPNVNTDYHDACIGLSPDGHKLFIYHSDKGNSGDIYASSLKGTEWTRPELMGKEINSAGWEPSATIAPDERTIFFSSDRHGGYGGMDIWYIKKKADGSWGDPVNMGPKVNSKYDEDSPYIHPDNKTLFFSSNGHRSMGGYDIFTTVYNDSTNLWDEPENAGYPINTADDEMYFIWSADGTRGYFSAWRPDSYGEKDLYVIHRPEGVSNLLVLKGHVYDKETRQPVEASITLTDNETHEKVVYHSNSASGRYMVVLPHGIHYGISIDAQGYLFHSENFDIPSENPFFEVKKDVYLEHVKPGNAIMLKNIFFESGKMTFRDESKPELEKLYKFLTEHTGIKIEITGYCDDNEKYDPVLSEQRAQAVVNFLVEKGIEASRLVAKTCGEFKQGTGMDGKMKECSGRTELRVIE